MGNAVAKLLLLLVSKGALALSWPWRLYFGGNLLNTLAHVFGISSGN